MTVLHHELARKVDIYLDENHERFAELGRELFEVFNFDKENDRVSTQIRNLQQVVSSARRFADIEDFIKNQMGKSGNKEWRKVGDHVLSELKTLRTASTEIAAVANEAMAVRLRLARGWVRSVVSEYLYRVAQAQMGAAS